MIELLEQLKQGLASAPEKVSDSFEPIKQAKVERLVDPYFLEDGFLSRSKLNELKAIREKGEYQRPPESVFYWGSEIDKFFTEPWLFDSSDYTEFELLQFVRAKQAFQEALPWMGFDRWHKDPKQKLGFRTQREIYRKAFNCKGINVKAKAKLDFWFPATKAVIDLKSTTKQSLGDFTKDIISHGLDIQAAWYSDIARASSFKLAVVSYHKDHMVHKALSGNVKFMEALAKPSQCWVIDMQPYIKEGREKYIEQIRLAKEAGQI